MKMIDKEAHLSRIEDFLFLSDYKSACSRELIDQHKIGHIVSILNNREEIDTIQAIHKDLNLMCIELTDTYGSNINQYFGKVYFFIERAREKEEKVLIHCKGGISRSPTIVASYLIRKYRMKVCEALRHICRVRICIDPNDSFFQQLRRCYILMLKHS
jgi:serine/threonine/tyrosine-interacting protein